MKEAYLNNYLNLNWLRPENALCQAIDAFYARPLLNGAKILEVGCGNGYFSFTMMGGEFTSDYDYYIQTDTKNFCKNADIYDSLEDINISTFIREYPKVKFSLGIDNKKSLLTYASQLNLYDSLSCKDLNEGIGIKEYSFDVVFCNMLHWLNDPYKLLKDLERSLIQGGKVVLIFPNPKIFKFCLSYSWDKQKMGSLWKRLNRGRLESLKWVKTTGDFEKEMKMNGLNFKTELAKTYQNSTTLLVWDIGLRFLSVPLIKISKLASPQHRREIKANFIESCLPYLEDLMENELNSKEDGGWNLIVLSKK